MKTLTCYENQPAWSGQFTCWYRNELISDKVHGAFLEQFARNHGYTHVKVSRSHTERVHTWKL